MNKYVILNGVNDTVTTTITLVANVFI